MDVAEEKIAGEPFASLPQQGRPPCADERAPFMCPSSLERVANHPYKKRNEPLYEAFAETPFHHPPYSVAAIPFRWTLLEQVQGEEEGVEGIVQRYGLTGYRPEREPELTFESDWVQEFHNQRIMLDTFFSALRPEQSLCFFYAKKTPLSDDRRRVIVGVGLIRGVGRPVEYRYNGSTRLRSILWERNVLHSIRPKGGQGFLLPYQELLRLSENAPELNLHSCLAFAPDDHWSEFSYTAEHVSHDAAISALLNCAKAIRSIRRWVEGDWDGVLAWIDDRLNRLWTSRGAFPGFGSALSAFGLERGTLLAHEIVLHQETKHRELADPWVAFEEVLRNPAPFGPEAAAVGSDWKSYWRSLPDERKALLKLLSRFALSRDQATRMYQPTERKKAGIALSDQELLANPYLVYEADRLTFDAVQLRTVDRGLLPDPVVAERFPLRSPSVMESSGDPRRLRAWVISVLECGAEEGHTVLPVSQVIQGVRDLEVAPPVPASVDTLPLVERRFDGLVERCELRCGGEATYGLQLARLAHTGRVIRRAFNARIVRGARNPGLHSWRELIDAQFPPIRRAADRDLEELARREKTAALEELFASRLSVLVGAAGTGKTTLLRVLCAMPEVERRGVLLLAPTGKARVRLEMHTGRKGGMTLAQFLLPLERYEWNTGRYVVNPRARKVDEYGTVVIDECSMLTEEQLAATLDALKKVDRLVLVGDPRQLPPIGTGRPFVDLVRKLCPPDVHRQFPRVARGYAELTVSRRQTGGTRDDLLFAQWFSGQQLDPGADEIWDELVAGRTRHIRAVQWDSPEDLEAKLIEQLVEVLGLSGPEDQRGFECSLGGSLFRGGVYFHPARGREDGAGERAEAWQILSPVRAGAWGVEAINRGLRGRFRVAALAAALAERSRKIPKPMGPQGLLWGDKVISVCNGVRNDTFPQIKGGAYIANGDIGIVVGQYRGQKWQPKRPPWKLEVEFPSWSGTKIGYERWEFGEEREPPLELAYALTIHKCQGSEFGRTFVVVPNPCHMASRELLYTALTRQSERVILLHQGPLTSLKDLADRSDTALRLTNLLDEPTLVEEEGHFLDHGLIHRTCTGVRVRSKSELVIAQILERLKAEFSLSYRYEEPLRIDGATRYPDFTIEDDSGSGRCVFLEHLGMLDNKEYRARWRKKLKWYEQHGILPFEKGGGPIGTLVTTEEGTGLDELAIERRILEAFGIRG